MLHQSHSIRDNSLRAASHLPLTMTSDTRGSDLHPCLFWRLVNWTKLPTRTLNQASPSAPHTHLPEKTLSYHWWDKTLKTRMVNVKMRPWVWTWVQSPPQSRHVSRVGSKQQVDDKLDLQQRTKTSFTSWTPTCLLHSWLQEHLRGSNLEHFFFTSKQASGPAPAK